MTKRLSKWILKRAGVFAVVACLVLISTNSTWEENQTEPDAVRLSLSGTDTNPPVTHADVRLSYNKRQSHRRTSSRTAAQVSEQAVYAIAADLKKRIIFPFDVNVIFEECEDPDSFYEEGTHKIIICYELVDAYYHLFARTARSRAARDEAAKGAIVSMFLHEVAHALIDGWDFPIVGREEDAADQFSTLLLINDIPDGERMALDSARSFKLLAELEKNVQKDYSDPHSLDEQRFFNTICLVYGHRPEQYEYLIREGTMPPDRAFDCEEYYARVNKSWRTLLTPHFALSNDGRQRKWLFLDPS